MEAAPAPAPPPAPEKAGALARVGAVLLALVLAFVCAVGVAVMLDIGETTPCADVQSIADLNDDGECYDGSSGKKTVALVLGWPGSALAGLAAILALGFAIRGRGGRTLLITIAAAAVLIAASLVIG